MEASCPAGERPNAERATAARAKLGHVPSAGGRGLVVVSRSRANVPLPFRTTFVDAVVASNGNVVRGATERIGAAADHLRETRSAGTDRCSADFAQLISRAADAVLRTGCHDRDMSNGARIVETRTADRESNHALS